MTSARLRWGALLWLLTLQFFVLETLAQVRYDAPYSRVDDVISALGAADSAGRQLMNASFVIQAALILGGALLLRPALRGAAGRVAPMLLGATALGTLLVGVFPLDGNGTLHAIGAVAYFVGGGLGLIALAYAVRPRSELLGTVVVLLGIVATAATIFFLTGVVGYLGEGGTERAAAYPLPIALALTGAMLSWTSGRADEPTSSASLQAERAEQEIRRAEQARVRDAALEAAARRSQDDDRSDIDPDDPWAPTPRG